VRDKYLTPLMGLDNISLRPASSSSASRKRVSGAGLTPAEQIAATTPIGRSRDHMVDGLAETVRAQSSPGLRSAEPATLPAAALKPRIGPRIALVGAIGLGVGVVLVLALRGSGPGSSPSDPASPPTVSATTVAADPTTALPATATASSAPISTSPSGSTATASASATASAVSAAGAPSKTATRTKATSSAKAPPVPAATDDGLWRDPTLR